MTPPEEKKSKRRLSASSVSPPHPPKPQAAARTGLAHRSPKGEGGCQAPREREGSCTRPTSTCNAKTVCASSGSSRLLCHETRKVVPQRDRCATAPANHHRSRGRLRLWTSTSPHHPLVLIMRSDPKPRKRVPVSHRQNAITIRHPRRPERTHSFQLQRRVSGILCKYLVCLVARSRTSSGSASYSSQNVGSVSER